MASFKQRLKRRLVSKPRYILILHDFARLDMSKMPACLPDLQTQPRMRVLTQLWPRYARPT